MKNVELIYDSSCPNIASAREALLRAFSTAEALPKWTEWDRAAKESPPYVRDYGSPTILVDGIDVAGDNAMTGGDACRLYADSSGAFSGIPPVERIVAALNATAPSTTGPWRGLAAALPGAGALLLPLGTCPACWPAYAGFLSSLGLGFLFYERYLLPIVVVFLAISLGGLLYRARSRRGYGPFFLGLLGSVVAVVGKFALAADFLLYRGFAVLVGAAVWNVWPRKEFASGCPKCARESDEAEVA